MTEAAPLTPRQQQVLEFIDVEVRRRGYPPSVREIGEAVGLSSSSTVHAHLGALQDKGYLKRDPTKPRAIEICFEPDSGAIVDRRPVKHVPLVGDVAAETRGGRPAPGWGVGTKVRWSGRVNSSAGYLGSNLGVVMTAAI